MALAIPAGVPRSVSVRVAYGSWPRGDDIATCGRLSKGAGEESGKLGEVLDEISVYYAKQLRDNIKAVTSMIEPLMILVMGAIVGFIAMAIILPIFKMSQLVK